MRASAASIAFHQRQAEAGTLVAPGPPGVPRIAWLARGHSRVEMPEILHRAARLATGLSRFELSGEHNPHSCSPSARGVRACRIVAESCAGRAAAYDPYSDAWYGADPRDDASQVHLLVRIDAFPPGYRGLRYSLAVQEGGHALLMLLLALGAGGDRLGLEPCCSDTAGLSSGIESLLGDGRWKRLATVTLRPSAPPVVPLATIVTDQTPSVWSRLADLARGDAGRRRWSGSSPWGLTGTLAPLRANSVQVQAAAGRAVAQMLAPRLDGALGLHVRLKQILDLTPGVWRAASDGVLHLVSDSWNEDALQESFTYHPSSMSVRGMNCVWGMTIRLGQIPSDAALTWAWALCGAIAQAISLVAAEDGAFSRPYKAFNGSALGAALGADTAETAAYALLIGRASFRSPLVDLA